MRLSNSILSRLLFFGGIGTLAAFIAVITPAAWLADIAQWMSIEFPPGPLPIYLARHLSLLYGMVGVLFLWFAGDVARYRPLLPKLGIAAVAFGVAQTVIGITSAMPDLYTAFESLSTIFGGIGLFAISRPLSDDESLEDVA